MKKLFLSWLILLSASLSGFAQQADLAKNNSADTVGRWNSGIQLSKARFKPIAFVAPAVLITYGFIAVNDRAAIQQLDLSTKDELQEDHPLFAAHVDDYMQFAPALAVYALNFSGLKGRHNLFDASMLYITSAAIMGASTHFVKQGVGRLRPDNSGSNSFPSGHTASAFMAAEFLHQEYKDVHPFIGYGGYLVATATGALRLYNNKHWFSDVVAGAGFGIASTKIAYLIYPYIKRVFKNKKNLIFTLMPYHQQACSGLVFAGKL